MENDLMIKYLTNPASIMMRPDISLIQRYKDQFPYVQSFHLLLSVAINQSESIFSTNFLGEAAIYAGSRAKLYQYFTKGIEVKQFNQDINKSTSISRLQPTKNKVPKKGNDLIDKFIKSKASIQRPKAEFYDPADKASKSIIESEEFVTETLAKIYTMQQRYDKALKIYEKLYLLNPDKSDYFALLINHLKDKINE